MTGKSDNYTQIIPGLYLGGYQATKPSVLKRLKIKAVLSIGEEVDTYFKDMPKYIDHLYYSEIDDAPYHSKLLQSKLPEMLDFIDEHLDQQDNVLVHCYAGISRSATVVAAFIKSKTDLSGDECIYALQQIRSIVKPNTGFKAMLQQVDLDITHPTFYYECDDDGCPLCSIRDCPFQNKYHYIACSYCDF